MPRPATRFLRAAVVVAAVVVAAAAALLIGLHAGWLSVTEVQSLSGYAGSEERLLLALGLTGVVALALFGWGAVSAVRSFRAGQVRAGLACVAAALVVPVMVLAFPGVGRWAGAVSEQRGEASLLARGAATAGWMAQISGQDRDEVVVAVTGAVDPQMSAQTASALLVQASPAAFWKVEPGSTGPVMQHYDVAPACFDRERAVPLRAGSPVGDPEAMSAQDAPVAATVQAALPTYPEAGWEVLEAYTLMLAAITDLAPQYPDVQVVVAGQSVAFDVTGTSADRVMSFPGVSESTLRSLLDRLGLTPAAR